MDARPGRAGAIDRIAGDRHEARVQKEGSVTKQRSSHLEYSGQPV